MQSVRKLPLWFFLGLLACFFFLFFCRKTLLTGSDLGRHITNGRVIMESGKIFSNNLYSYAHPDYHAPNHHWLFGVIVYYLNTWFGFASLTLLSASLYTGSVAIFLWYTGKKFGKLAMVLAGVLVLPLLADRNEVRPEAFSLFFFASEVVALLLWSEKKLSSWIVGLVFFVCSLAWVNIHIFFFLSFVVLGSFGLQALVEQNWKKVGLVCVFGIVTILATLCNPLGIEGALYPFKILNEYGYPVAENQSPLFYLRLHTRPLHWYLVGIFVVSVASAIATAFAQYKLLKLSKNVASAKIAWHHYVGLFTLFIIFFSFTNKLIRFANFFALLAIVVIAGGIVLLRPFLDRWWQLLTRNTIVLSFSSLCGLMLLVAVLTSGLFNPFNQSLGLGLYPQMHASAEFFRTLQVTGPIFNNFDIGGYLIYHLYPNNQIYVDNRAEAYPASFLEEYKAAQQDPEVWKKIDGEYRFGAIYFNRLENTDWGQNFLISTLDRPEWVPIFVDPYTIIFIRDIPEHAEILEKYRLPDELFKVTTY